MGGSTTTQNTNQTSTQQLPPWVNQASQQNYAFAQSVANRPLQQYQGQQVADVGPATQQAWQLAQGSGAAGADYYNAASAGLLSQMGQSAPTVTPGMLASTSLQPYMDPYTQNVQNTALQQLEAQRQQSIMGNNATAVQKGAFGGSRQGITDAVTNAQSALGAGQLTAQLQQSNFTQAQAAAQSDLARQLAAAQGNQQAALTSGQQNLTAAGQLESQGNDAVKNVLQQYSMLSDAGTQQQTQAQNQINANMNQFNQAWNYPTQQLNTLLSALGMSPYGSTQTTQGQTQTTQPPNYAQSALGLLSMGSGMFGASDETLKKDKQKLGKDPKTGIDMYAFRYKGDPKSYPKVVGPMAQDVEKKFPGMVAKIGGKKAIRTHAPPLTPASAMAGGMLRPPAKFRHPSPLAGMR
jgi:hypothetical protein